MSAGERWGPNTPVGGVSRLCFDSIMFCRTGSESSLWDQQQRQWSLAIIDFYQSSDFSAGFRGTSLPKSSRYLKFPGVRIIRDPTRKRRTGYLFLTGENRSNSLRSLSCWFCNCGVTVTVLHRIELKTETISVDRAVQWLCAALT